MIVSDLRKERTCSALKRTPVVAELETPWCGCEEPAKWCEAVFAFFPHGVNSDFRVLMDGMMYDAFPATYEKGGPARTLAATVLFQIPGIRQLSLATACVDAGRKTATRCLKAGYSLMLCPGGQDEQLETIYGRERVYLKRRAGFIRLAIIHGVPVVPATGLL